MVSKRRTEVSILRELRRSLLNNVVSNLPYNFFLNRINKTFPFFNSRSLYFVRFYLDLALEDREEMTEGRMSSLILRSKMKDRHSDLKRSLSQYVGGKRPYTGSFLHTRHRPYLLRS